MSRDRPRSEYRREVEQAGETTGTSGGTAGQSSGADFVPFGWPTLPGRNRRDGAGDDERRSGNYRNDYERERARGQDRTEASEDGLVDGRLISLLIVAGVALFLFPEPATSALGLALVGAGVFAWLVDLAA